jgi:hypothetical protein
MGRWLAPGQLNSQDFKARAEAVAAITDMAPQFMDQTTDDYFDSKGFFLSGARTRCSLTRSRARW